jgi:hypothetical protein
MEPVAIINLRRLAPNLCKMLRGEPGRNPGREGEDGGSSIVRGLRRGCSLSMLRQFFVHSTKPIYLSTKEAITVTLLFPIILPVCRNAELNCILALSIPDFRSGQLFQQLSVTVTLPWPDPQNLLCCLLPSWFPLPSGTPTLPSTPSPFPNFDEPWLQLTNTLPHYTW